MFRKMNPKVLEQLHIFSILFLSPITCAPVFSLMFLGPDATLALYVPYAILWFWMNEKMCEAERYHAWMALPRDPK